MQQWLNNAPILLKNEKEAGQGVRPQGAMDPVHMHQAPIRATNVASMDENEVMGCYRV